MGVDKFDGDRSSSAELVEIFVVRSIGLLFVSSMACFLRYFDLRVGIFEVLWENSEVGWLEFIGGMDEYLWEDL